ncbi:HNH endonuclease [Emticicia sp. C21]|uniref:HNH endonuclease n=1 Tax=Emticicia sp. C21 TaxID=2302915 RepID=UPI0011C1A060|nr:HNH endonuclease [Emticicia sp. C21]
MNTSSNKICVFCDSELTNNNRSKEHVIPKWLLNFLNIGKTPVQPSHITFEGRLKSQRSHTLQALLAGSVCSDCNNNWMSRLENEAMPILKPLIRGEKGVVELNEKERMIVSRWTAKTAYALHCSSDFVKIVPNEHYKYIKDNLNTLPDNVWVFGQQHHGKRPFNWQQSSLIDTVEEDGKSSSNKEKLIKTYKISFQFGKLMLMIAFMPHENIKMAIWAGIHIPLIFKSVNCYWYHKQEFPWYNSEKAFLEFDLGLHVLKNNNLKPLHLSSKQIIDAELFNENQGLIMKLPSGTIIDEDGKILFYSIKEFYDRIIIGDDCFICGASKVSKKFNAEHILPNWLLTKYNLHNKSITLPNGIAVKYGHYTVPCCKECNSNLGKHIEKPISELLKLSYNEFGDALSSDFKNLQLLYKWLTLVFFKIHLKDSELFWNLDKRKGGEKISEMYEWETMHHIHCMVRGEYTNAKIDYKTLGSIFILPALQHELIDSFDVVTDSKGKTIMIRLNELCIVCVLNDSCAVYNLFQNIFQEIKGALTPFQLKEVFAHMVYINTHIKDRPIFYSNFSENREHHINVKIPDNLQLIPDNEEVLTLGEILHFYIKDMIGQIENREEVLAQIKEGKRSYLFDSNGDFLNLGKELY